MDEVVLEESQDVTATSDVLQTPWNSTSTFEIKPEDTELNVEDTPDLESELNLEAELSQFLVYKIEKTFSCDICAYKSSKKRHLTQHVIRSHTKQFACDICLYKCSLKSRFDEHMSTHTGEKPFACVICEYKCIRKASLKQHMKNHMYIGEGSFSLELGNHKSFDKSNFQQLMTTLGVGEQFACNYCDYKCTVKEILLHHMQKHSSEKPFVCVICDYRFSLRENLEHHLRLSHSGG